MCAVLFRRAAPALLFVVCALASGCGPGYEVAEVEGVVRVQGKPGAKLHVQFYPDPAKGANGPISAADTDDEGRFKLVLQDTNGSGRPGAVVGWHRVVLSDLQMAASETGKGVPVRLTSDYMAAGTTPLTREVARGKQAIEIDIPGK